MKVDIIIQINELALILLHAHKGVSWGYRGVCEGGQPLFFIFVSHCLMLL